MGGLIHVKVFFKYCSLQSKVIIYLVKHVPFREFVPTHAVFGNLKKAY